MPEFLIKVGSYAVGTWCGLGSAGIQNLFNLILGGLCQQHEVVLGGEAGLHLTELDILRPGVQHSRVKQMGSNILLKSFGTIFMTLNYTCWCLQLKNR